MSTDQQWKNILLEHPADHVARIILNRPDTRNAQDATLLYELNEAFDRVAQDDDVKVVILAANGPHFSSGHDLRQRPEAQLKVLAERDTVGTWCGFGCAGAESRMAIEKELYIGFSERWRNMPKPTIAEVQGKVVAGGLMLMWPCDIIVAETGARFQDNTLKMGVNGVEFFNHPWEFGIRKAKEMLFTGDWVTAEEAKGYGMVNHVVPPEELAEFTLAMAKKIAEKPLFALKLAKESVNAAQDHQGRVNAMQVSFAYHQLCHSHNMNLFDMPADPGFLLTNAVDIPLDALPEKARKALEARMG
ncbi:enoyl-CoA hydratase [Sphingopyxis kveilinensis]|uniref:enoyl-CoA hydratase n=1 Tax=Sphingopyxis kveilinensis TaxID=3114367 RepID=UPI0030D52534